jgi:hypothetical protein
MNIRRVLVLGAIAVFVGTASPTMLAQGPQIDKKEQEKRNKQQQEDVTALVQLVDTAAAAAAGSPEQRQGDIEIAWDSNHFIKGQDGSTYIPFTLKLDRADLASEKAALYIRAVAKGATPAPVAAAPANKDDDKKAAPARTIYPWDNAYFINVRPDGVLQRALALPGGEYDVFIAVKDQSTGDKKQVAKSGLLRRTLVVPDYKKPELATSSIMIGTIEPLAAPLSAQQQQESPYTFGAMRIVPVNDAKLAKAGQLSLIFWIYGAAVNPDTKKPDVTIDYSFHQKTGDTEKYFNKTAPQELNATTLPPEFDLAAGHQLPGSLEVPLASFPAGDYRLEILIKDKATGKSVTQNVNFTVNAA